MLCTYATSEFGAHNQRVKCDNDMPTNVSGSVSFAVHVCVSASLAANVNTVVAANFLS